MDRLDTVLEVVGYLFPLAVIAVVVLAMVGMGVN